jgi:predicted transcriptional regulator
MYKLKPIKIDDVINNEYAKLFKFLFNKNFQDVNKISSEAKILYSFFKERINLSIENRWINNVGEVYIIFTIEEMEDLLNCGNKKVIKVKKELLDIGLIKEVRQGLNKPNLIYVYDLDVSSAVDYRKCQKDISKNVKKTFQDVSKEHAIKTNHIKTNHIKTSSQKNDDEEFVNNFIKEFKTKYAASLTKKRIEELYLIFGKDNLNNYLNNFDKFIDSTEIKNKASYFYTAVLEQYKIPAIIKNTKKTNNMPIQSGNYKQREYDDEYFNSLYENI